MGGPLDCDLCKVRMPAPAPFALALDNEAGYTFCGVECLRAWLATYYPRPRSS